MSYQKRIRRQYQQNLNEHLEEITKYVCLDPECEKLSDVEGALCGWCEQRLTELCKRIDGEIKRLTIIGEEEARQISSPGGGQHFAKNGEATNITPASMLADELDNLALRLAKIARNTLGVRAPKWSGYPGSYLTNLVPFLARQVWVLDFLNGWGATEFDNHGRPQIVQHRGLKEIFAEIRTKYDDEDEEPRPLPITCPACENLTLQFHPANHPHQPNAIICHYEPGPDDLPRLEPDGYGLMRYCGWACREDAQNWLHALAVLHLQIEAEQRRKPARTVGE